MVLCDLQVRHTSPSGIAVRVCAAFQTGRTFKDLAIVRHKLHEKDLGGRRNDTCKSFGGGQSLSSPGEFGVDDRCGLINFH